MPSATAIELLDLIQSHRVTAVIYVAAKLGIAELLRNGPRSLDQLAQATSAHPDALRRLLTALFDRRHLRAGRQRRVCADRIGFGARRIRRTIFQGMGDLRRRNAFQIMEWNA